MLFLQFVNNSFLVAMIGAMVYAIQNYIEKLIFLHPGGDVNKYYLTRNFIISWGFMFFLIFISYFEHEWIDYKTTMNTIGWGAFFEDNYLMGLTIVASIIVIVSVYVSYLGLKFNPLSQYVATQTLVYLVITVLIGVFILEEKVSKYQIMGILFGCVAIYLIQYRPKSASNAVSFKSAKF